MDRRAALRVGIIGCGNVVINDHIPALLRLEGARPVAVADLVPERRQQALNKSALPAESGYETHGAMLDATELDYAVVAVPPSVRPKIIADCARSGVHVLAEKPLATRPADAAEARAVVSAAGLKLGLVHNYLFYPEYVLLRQLISKGEIGQLRHVTLNFLGVPDNPGAGEYRPLWRHDPQESGGGVLMDMIHALYLAEFLVGEEAKAVSAVVDNLNRAADAVESLALIHLYFENNYASINMGWGHGPGGVEVSGSQGRILVFYHDYGTGPFSKLDSFVLINEKGSRMFRPRQGHAAVDNFVAIHRAFVDAIHNDGKPAATGEEGQRSLEAAMASYCSAVEGRVMALPLAEDHPVYRRGVAGLREVASWKDGPAAKRGLFGLVRS